MTFAAYALARLPALSERLRRPDVERWLAGEDSVVVDGERLWILGGDRLGDEAEAKLDWARARGVVAEAELDALRAEWRGSGDDDTVAIDFD